MNDKLALYTIFSLSKILHFHLGWDAAQRDLCRVGEEFVDEVMKDKAESVYNDTEAIMQKVSEVLVNTYKVASAIDVEIAKEMSVAKAAIMPPYRVYVKDCVFQELHQLFKRYRIRRNWRRTPKGRDGKFLICPVMNLFVHAIDANSDYLGGHCLEATKMDKGTCTCMIDIFSRELDIAKLPEEENPEFYRIS